MIAISTCQQVQNAVNTFWIYFLNSLFPFNFGIPEILCKFKKNIQKIYNLKVVHNYVNDNAMNIFQPEFIMVANHHDSNLKIH